MSLRRRLLLAVVAAPLWWGATAPLRAQEAPPVPRLERTARTKEPPLLLTRTGARRTVVVAAVERAKGAVVNIHSERTVNPPSAVDGFGAPAQNRVNGMGTGILIDARGYIVTCCHVVEDVSILRVRLADGTTRPATVIARNPALDLAILKIDVPRALPTLPIGTATDLMAGETVIAIGNAYGYEHTVSVGVVSALKRDVSLNKDMAYKSLIQTDASINPGNSGGPLINVNGEVVGVNVAIRAGAQNIGFAIPADQMVRAVADMLRGKRRTSAYDGLACRDALERTEDGLVRRVVVDHVEAGSPAETAGLKSGDLLVRLGDVELRNTIDVERALLDRKGGETVPVVLRRQKRETSAELALAAPDRDVRPAGALDVVWTRLGLQLAPVPADTVSRVNSQLHGGLEVTGINASGAAYRAGIRKGDVLVGLHQWETVSLDNVTYVLNHPDLGHFNPLPFYILRGGQVRRGQLPLP